MAKTKPGKNDLESYTIVGTNKFVRPGDCVLMRPSDTDKPPYVARVEKIEADHRSNIKVRVRWYYRPEESIGGRRQFHGAKELFLSDHFDAQSALTIEGKCTVHSFENYTKLEIVGVEDYFCRFEYKAATGGFTPDRVAVYCKCEMPYNPDDLMMQCDGCKDWFHPSCLGMTIEEAKKLENFLCSHFSSDDDSKRPLNGFPVSPSVETKVMVSGDKNSAKDEDMVDFRGNSVDKSKTGGWLGAGLILGVELSERICVMGISMNLVTYLVGDLHISTAKSATIVTNFMGTLILLGLLGGFVADAKLGRYLTIATSAAIAAIGVTLLTLATSIPSLRPPTCDIRNHHHKCIEANGKQLALLYAALYTIALGGGGIKSNISGYGSDQFDPAEPKEEKSMIFFFNRFYFAISIGSLFAVIVLVYVQDNVGRGYGYGISAGTMIIALAILVYGTPFYRFKKPKGSSLTAIWRVILLAWKKRNLPYPPNPSFLNEYQQAKVPHTENFKCLDKAAIIDAAVAEPKMKAPWIASTVTQVEEVKMVFKLIPIWSTCILFWTIYSQMTTFTVEQATFMKRNIGSFVIPSGSFSTFLFISILLFTSLNEKLVVPLARKLTHNTQGLTSLQRIGIGLIFAMVAMIAAAAIEKHRRVFAIENKTKISAFWLVPQFFLVGAGEAFAYVGQLEFFIREAPERMKSMSTGLFLSTLSMGFFVSSLLVSLVDEITKKRWLRSNLNKGKLDYFYLLLAVLAAMNFIFFLVFATRHKYIPHHTNPIDSIGKELESSNGVTDEKIDEKVGIEAMELP